MKKILSFLLVVLVMQEAVAQKVIIGGKEGNRPLQWSDFTGTPDNGSSFFANTFWKSSFSFSGAKFNGDAAILEGFEFTLQLDPQGSWVKEGKQTTDLLKHEQGHFNIGLLYMKDVLKKIKETSFSRANYQQEVKAILSEAQKKYHEMGDQYDRETAHSINKEEQSKWDAFFIKELN